MESAAYREAKAEYRADRDGGQPQGIRDMKTGRPDTEIEEVMDTLREVLRMARNSASEMHSRVVTPVPRAGDPTVSAIAATHAQKLRGIIEIAGEIKGLLGEMNGKI